jgi:hypothetical protein
MTNTLSNHNDHLNLNYTDLQNCVDALVGKFGLEKSVEIINSFSNNTKIGRKEVRKLKLIKDYIIAETILIFDLDEQNFFQSEVTEYREARMACYHLLNKYTENSHSKIAQTFGKKRGSAFYFIHKCNEILSMPQFYRSFIEKYRGLESSTIHFISKLK